MLETVLFSRASELCACGKESFLARRSLFCLPGFLKCIPVERSVFQLGVMDAESRIIQGEMTSVLDHGIEDQGKREEKANEDLNNQKLVKQDWTVRHMRS